MPRWAATLGGSPLDKNARPNEVPERLQNYASLLRISIALEASKLDSFHTRAGQ